MSKVNVYAEFRVWRYADNRKAGNRKRVERCHDAGCGMAGDGFMDVKICFLMSNYVRR